MAGNVQSSGVQSSDVQQPTDPSKSPSILEAAETSGLFLVRMFFGVFEATDFSRLIGMVLRTPQTPRTGLVGGNGS